MRWNLFILVGRLAAGTLLQRPMKSQVAPFLSAQSLVWLLSAFVATVTTLAAELRPLKATNKLSLSLAADLNPLLLPLRDTNRLPALAAAVVRRGEIIAVGAIGTRRADGSVSVTIDDKFHIGSCTKSMTAALAAMLVEEGK